MTLHSILIQKLLSTNSHLGRRVATHHLKEFTYGVRNGVAILDSDKTLICMRSACNFISILARQRASFMFVNTNPLFDEIIVQMTKKIGCYSPSMNSIWKMGGFLTNRYSPKKFRSRNKKMRLGPTTLPDCVVVIDTDRKSSVVMEASKLHVPIVALVDSSMPLEVYRRITYPIPANDSVQFVYLFCNMVTKTILSEKKKLLCDEEDNVVDRELDEKIDADSSSKQHRLVIVPYQSLGSIPEGSFLLDLSFGLLGLGFTIVVYFET